MEISQGANGSEWDVLPKTVHDAAVAIKQRRNDEYEVWGKKDSAFNRLLVYSGVKIFNGKEDLARTKLLYHVRLDELTDGVYQVVKAYVPGLFGWENTYAEIWPSSAQATFPVRQWSETAKLVMPFVPDYNNGSGRRFRFTWNLVPDYPKYLRGELKDPVTKPYNITLRPEPIVTPGQSVPLRYLGAAPRPERLIAGFAPSWVEGGKFSLSFKTHVIDQAEFKNQFYPKMTEEADEPLYLEASIDFVRGYYAKSDKKPLQTLRPIECYYSPTRDQVLLYNESTNQLMYMRRDNGKIITYFRPGVGKDGKKLKDYKKARDYVDRDLAIGGYLPVEAR